MTTRTVPEALLSCWHPVAYSHTVEARPHGTQLLGEHLVVWRDHSGTPYAMRDLCIHRVTALSLGWVADDCIVCPYHGWRYKRGGQVHTHPVRDAIASNPTRGVKLIGEQILTAPAELGVRGLAGRNTTARGSACVQRQGVDGRQCLERAGGGDASHRRQQRDRIHSGQHELRAHHAERPPLGITGLSSTACAPVPRASRHAALRARRSRPLRRPVYAFVSLRASACASS